MAMQTDVSSVHLNSNGFAYIGRTRVKGLVVSTSSAGGQINIWDSLTAPVTASYEQAAFTVTITKVAHGLSTGQRVGFSFNAASGNSATNGNYTITVTGNDTFTITDINSRTIVAGTVCTYVANTSGSNSTQWHFTNDMGGVAGTYNIVVPGEGMLIENAIYVSMVSSVTSVAIFYG
jgi:hypothetical protein